MCRTPGPCFSMWKVYSYYMDTTQQASQMKTTRAQEAIISLLKKQLETQPKNLVRNSFFKIFDTLNNKLKQQLWIEAQL